MNDYNKDVNNKIKELENTPIKKRDQYRETTMELYSMLKGWWEALKKEDKKRSNDLYQIFDNEHTTTKSRKPWENQKASTNAKD